MADRGSTIVVDNIKSNLLYILIRKSWAVGFIRGELHVVPHR